MADQQTNQLTQSDQSNILRLKQRLSHRRWLIERNWWGNTLFHLGIQWIVYDVYARRWRQRKLSPSVPTPITNLFRSTIDTVKSAIAQHDPRFLGTPTHDTPKSIAAAGSADTQLQICLKEGQFDRAKMTGLDWLLLTGNFFLETIWDDSEATGMEPIPWEQCQDCQAEFPPNDESLLKVKDGPLCPKCGSPFLNDHPFKQEWVPRGKLRYDPISPFEMYLDPAIEVLQDQPFILKVKSYTVEQVQERWDKKVDPDRSPSSVSALMRDTIPSLVAPSAALPFAAQTALDRENRVTVFHAYIKRHKDYPKGAYIVLTSSGDVLEKRKPFPWTRKTSGEKYYPLVHFRFGTIGGRAWGYSPADDLHPKQYQLNKAESLFTLIMSRMANPIWLIPSSSNPSRITGEIGVQIEYTPVGGAKPERVAGAEAPQSLVKYIQDVRQSFDELSGAFSAVRGRSMGSRTPVGTVQTLQERGFGRWTTVFQNLELGYQELAHITLEIWRANAQTPRVQAIKNAVGGWTFQEFLAADWDDGVDIQVEAGSLRPKTQAEKLQTYMQLAQAGLLNVQDKSQAVKILEDTGMLHMIPGVEEDTKQAYKENAIFMQWAKKVHDVVLNSQLGIDPQAEQKIHSVLADMPIMVHPLVDEHAVHFITHRRLALTDEFKALPEIVQNIFFQHMLGHKESILESKIFEQMANPQPSGNQQMAPVHGQPSEGVP